MVDLTTTQGYRPAQIILHWIVVLGLVIQIAIHEFIVRFLDARATDTTPASLDTILAWAHVCVGTMVLLAVIVRLYMRYRYGTLAHSPNTPVLQARMASLMHWALYVFLVLIAITGMLTWNGIAQLGNIHFICNVILFVLVLGHAAAGFYNHFVRKDGTLRRMFPARNRH